MVWESIPQTGSGLGKGPIPHGAELGPGGFEEVGGSRAEGAWGSLRNEEGLEVGGGISIYTLVGEEGDLVFYPEWDGVPVECFEDGSNMFIFAHPHQDPSSSVLDVLKLLNAFARDPNEECIALVQPGGDKGVDKLLCICQSKWRMEFGDVFEVIKGGFTQLLDVGFEREMRIHSNTQVGNYWGKKNVLAREGDAGDGGWPDLVWGAD